MDFLIEKLDLPKGLKGYHSGVYYWKVRMALHMAHHQHPGNKAVHLFGGQLALFSVFLVTNLITIPSFIPMGCIDLGSFSEALEFLAPKGVLPLNNLTFPLIVLLLSIYIPMDILVTLLQAALSFIYWCCTLHIQSYNMTLSNVPLMFTSVLMFLVLGMVTPVYVGRRLEEFGLDDSAENIREAMVHKHPFYLSLLIPFHLLDVLFGFGYRPETAKKIQFVCKLVRKAAIGVKIRELRKRAGLPDLSRQEDDEDRTAVSSSQAVPARGKPTGSIGAKGRHNQRK